MRKDFSCHPGKHIIAWLIYCWDNGASNLELESRETKQLGSLSREGGIDKATGKKTQALSLWRQLLSSRSERYPFSEDDVCHPGKWTTMERENPSVVGLLRVEEQQVPIATTTVHRQQYRTNRHSLIHIHKLICQLESQGVISRTCSPFNSLIWPVQKSNGEWRLAVDYRGLNEVTPPMSAAVPDMLELQYKLESKAAKWYATTDITNAFFSIPLVVLEQGEAPEHLQYIDNIII
ncbi:hypothetical protein GRJ2_003233400 [Grus japonensis]|uniref:Reverse transcriptase domain-containing protein n=1 Tax=Grus japonensis TaxID=30415 RepID=A0ABC9YDL7_GRUJA